jgi:hypothetical protein
MEAIFSALDFFATGSGLLVTAAGAAFIVLLWEWRTALVGLFVVQLGVATLGVERYGVEAQWAALELVIMLLMLAMLAMSIVQTEQPRSLHQAGNWLVRLLALVLMILAWRVIELNIPVPVFGPSAVSLFGWLALCALLILGLGDNPFFSAIGLLLWLTSAQTLLAVLIPSANLFALIGGIQVLVALACSYLILLDHAPDPNRTLVLTDIVFPDENGLAAVHARANGAATEDDMTVDALPLPNFVQQLIDEAEAVAPPVPDTTSAAEGTRTAAPQQEGR